MASLPICRAMVFAAGLGTRLRPVTEHTPKPLVRVGGQALLDYALDRFEAAACQRIVVNLHHLGDQVRTHLAQRPRRGAEICCSDEPVLLETGGGIVQALPLLGEMPFFCANSDAIWFDGPTPALQRLAQSYCEDRMDALLLLHPTDQAVGYRGAGDFGLTPDAQLSRRGPRGYVFTGVSVLHPRLFRDRSVAPFSLRELYRAAEGDDGVLARMYGLVHDGDWVHVGSLPELAEAERFLERRAP